MDEGVQTWRHRFGARGIERIAALMLLAPVALGLSIKAWSQPPAPEDAAANGRLGNAPQRLQAAEIAQNGAAAVAAAEEIRASVESMDADASWSDGEARALLQAARTLELIGRRGDAAALAKRAAAGSDGRMQLEAAAVAWQLARRAVSADSGAKDGSEDGSDAAGIHLLADAEAALEAEDPLYRGIQLLVIGALSDSDQSYDQLYQQMLDAGVHAAVARLVDVHVAERQWRGRQLRKLAETMTRLQPALDSPRVDPLWAAWWANQRGLMLQHDGHYDEATEAHQQAVQLAAAAGRPELERTARDNLALLALRMGDYARARRLLQESVGPTPAPSTPSQWAAEINYAKALEGDRDFGRAQQRLRDLLQNSAGDPVDRATAENNLALSLYMTGAWEAAERHWRSCSEALATAFPEGHPYQSEVAVNLAWLDYERGKAHSAIERLQRAIDQIGATRGKEDPRFAEAQTYLARFLTAVGRTEEARQLISEALSARSSQLEATISALSPRDRLAVTQELRVHAESSAWPGSFDTFLELAPQLQIPVEEQYAAVLRWKSLLERASERFDRQRSQLPPSLLARRESVRRQLHDEYFRPVSRLARSRQAEKIAALEAELEEVERRFARTSERVAIAAAPQPAAVADALDEKTTLVDFVQHRTYTAAQQGQVFREESNYVAFVSRRNSEVVRVDLGSAEELDAAIASWRAAIESGSGNAESAGQQVAVQLWQPLDAAIGEASAVRICPDADLFQVPWAAIPLEDDTCVIDRVTLSIVPRVVAHDHDGPTSVTEQRVPRLLLVGGVDYGALRDRWPALPGTEAEIEAVAKAFSARFPEGEIERLEGPKATEAAVLEELGKASYVHLATHGFYLRRGDDDAFGLGGATAALNSGLVLAPPDANDPDVDQFLTADELGQGHHSNRSPLWVLSACETGLGRPQAGQGMVGLLTALDRAGARGTVASLWKVDDEATSGLMTEFYRQLWGEGLAPAVALRAAQLKIRRDRGQQTSDARHWGAFYFSDGTRRYQ